MTGAIGPRASIRETAGLPLAIVGVAGAVVGAFGDVWVGGHLASLLAGRHWRGPRFDAGWIRSLVGHGPAASWPGVSPALVWSASAAVLLAVLAAVAVVWVAIRRRLGPVGHPVRSLARSRHVASRTGRSAAAQAARLRPSLGTTSSPTLHDAGLPIGRLLPRGKTLVRMDWEDVVVVFMAPRQGKTSMIAVPQALSSPGALVLTSNKSDLWALTAGLRAERGRVWVFDPQALAHATQDWWWNPLRGVSTVESAYRLAEHFIGEVVRDGKGDFWSAAAHALLTSLLLAAGTSDGTLADVASWLATPTTPVPVDLLRAAGHETAASDLSARAKGHPETRDGIWETARTAARCLGDPGILGWVTPPGPGVEEFISRDFAARADTLYLLSKDSAGGAAPLVAAFADRVFQDAIRYAEARGGRLDPPMVAILDEAANVCKIRDLPRLYSHLGSRGIVPVTILQSYPQGVGVWGRDGMDALWGAATVKLIGSGMDDPDFLERVSRLIGEHHVSMRSLRYSDGGFGGAQADESLSLSKERILPVEALRELPMGQAVLLAARSKPALLRLQPWFEGPDSAGITSAQTEALAGLTSRAAAKEGASA